MFPGLDLYYADPARSLTTAGEELDDLDHDVSRGVKLLIVHANSLTTSTHSLLIDSFIPIIFPSGRGYGSEFRVILSPKSTAVHEIYRCIHGSRHRQLLVVLIA